jgi:hypothetical protein
MQFSEQANLGLINSKADFQSLRGCHAVQHLTANLKTHSLVLIMLMLMDMDVFIIV